MFEVRKLKGVVYSVPLYHAPGVNMVSKIIRKGIARGVIQGKRVFFNVPLIYVVSPGVGEFRCWSLLLFRVVLFVNTRDNAGMFYRRTGNKAGARGCFHQDVRLGSVFE